MEKHQKNKLFYKNKSFIITLSITLAISIIAVTLDDNIGASFLLINCCNIFCITALVLCWYFKIKIPKTDLIA